MKKCDTFPVGANSRRVVNEADASGFAAGKRTVKIVHGKTDVMDAGPTFREVFSNGCVRRIGFEKFHERITGLDGGNASAVGVVERNLGHAEEIAVEWQYLVERLYSDAHVGNAGGATGNISHGERAGVNCSGFEY